MTLLRMALPGVIILFMAANSPAQEESLRQIRINDDLQLLQLNEHTFIHISYIYDPNFGRYPSNGLVYFDADSAFLFDTPPNEGLTRTLLDWLADSLGIPCQGVVVNHWHNDCAGGLGVLNERNISSYGLQMTTKILAEQGLPEPGAAFDDSLNLSLGSRKIQCRYFGAGHTIDNIVVWLPDEQILFGGCIVKSAGARTLGDTADAVLDEWPATLARIKAAYPEVRIVVPGHGPPGDTGLLDHTIELLTR